MHYWLSYINHSKKPSLAPFLLISLTYLLCQELLCSKTLLRHFPISKWINIARRPLCTIVCTHSRRKVEWGRRKITLEHSHNFVVINFFHMQPFLTLWFSSSNFFKGIELFQNYTRLTCLHPWGLELMKTWPESQVLMHFLRASTHYYW